MKKIVLLVIGLLFLPVITIAYQVNIDAPETITAGKPLVVTGTTTFPPGMYVDVVLYYQLTTATEIKREVVSIRPDKTFRVVFDTTGLTTGSYKVEVPGNSMGNSVTMRLVRIVDRSEEILLDSPLTQQFSGILQIAGTIEGNENGGVQIEVIGPDNTVIFGPRLINTDTKGAFLTNVPIRIPGEYEVSFTDAKGFVGTRTITADGPQMAVPTLAEAAASRNVVSARAKTSGNTPAYFSVSTNPGPVMLYTSSGVDWIIEYIDDDGNRHVENNQDAQNPEKAAFTGTGSTIFVRVYPNGSAEEDNLTLVAENANTIVFHPKAPAPFAEELPVTSGEPAAVPLAPLSGLAALGIALFLRR